MTRRNQRMQRLPQPGFQAMVFGLVLEGLIARQTIATPGLVSSIEVGQAESEVPIILNLSADLPLLQPGDAGDAVLQLQTALTQLGWYQNPITGRYDATTEQAVRAFQQQEGLAVDGLIGPETWQQLALSLSPQSVFSQIPALGMNSLTFTPLIVAQPEPPPSPFWLLLMAVIPLVGGGLTYLRHRHQVRRKC